MIPGMLAEWKEANEALSRTQKFIKRLYILGVVVLCIVCLAVGFLWGYIIVNM